MPLCQCITSIWLFSRRARHGSAALYDYRVLQLAIPGVCSSLMAIVHLILQPRCLLRYWMPHSGTIDPKGLEYCRPVTNSRNPTDLSRDFDDLVLRAARWLLDVASLFALAWLSYAAGLQLIRKGEVMLMMSAFNYTWLRVFFGTMHRFHYYDGLAGLFALRFRKYIIPLSRRHLLGVFATLILSPFVFLALTIGTFLLAIPLIVGLYGVMSLVVQAWTLFSKPANWERYAGATYHKDAQHPAIIPDWDNIWTYGHISSTFPCPEAWKRSSS